MKPMLLELQAFGPFAGAERVDFAFAEIVSRGLAQWRERRLVPTHTGWLLGNELYGILCSDRPARGEQLSGLRPDVCHEADQQGQ